MHIEKNIYEALLGTLLDIAGKSKDSISARLDLEDMGIRKKLHLKANGNSYSVPHAPYKMTKAQISAFCAFIKNVKLPDGYASNLARCVSVDECKLQALKTHNREGRNKERVPRSTCGLSIFHHGANLMGAPRLTYDEKDYDRMVWYVLNNTKEVESFIEYVLQ